MEKSPDAFRTISEVAESLETPAHVLRFWESRFPQIRPVKRAGGRRYYRPSDVALLAGIKRLLHDEGMTIRGVQKILREHGIRHVARLGNGGEDAVDEAEVLEARLSAALGVEEAEVMPPAEAETAQIIALESVLNRAAQAQPVPPVQPAVQPDLWSQAGVKDEGEVPEAPMVELAETDVAEVVPMTPAAEAAGDAAVDLLSPPLPAEDAAPETAQDATGADSSDSDTTTEAPDAAAPDAAPVTLAARLRALPPGALAHHAEAVSALQDRILTLRAKLAETTRRRRR